MKINPKALALSLGIVSALLALILGVWFSLTGFGQSVVQMFQEIYAGLLSIRYDIDLSGAQNLGRNLVSLLMLTAFSFIDGVIAGLLIALFHNLFIKEEASR